MFVVVLELQNVVLYHNGGHLAASEKGHIGATDLYVVSEYKYLGIVTSICLSSISIQNRLATRA